MENQQTLEESEFNRAFKIEAAIDERGPRELLIVPSYNQYHVYDNDEMIVCIQQNEDAEWEQIEGPFTKGVIAVIGREIIRAQGQA